MTSRRRFATASGALLGLVGVLVFGGSLAAHADNGLFFDPSLDGSTFESADTFTFTGTTELMTSDLVVYLDGEQEICRIPAVNVTPDWSCETSSFDRPPLGEHVYTVQQITDPLAVPPAYNSDSATMTFELPRPTITGPTGEVAGNGYIEVTGGNGYPGAEIVVTVVDPGGVGVFCDTGVLDTFGNWSCGREFDNEFAPGSTVTVRATQFSEGADEEPTSDDFSFDIAPGDVRFDDSFEDADILWSPSAFTVSGTTIDTSLTDPIVVYSDADVEYCTDVDSFADGTWSCTPSGPPLDAGYYTFTVVQNGQSDTVDLLVRIPAPQLTRADGEPYTDPYEARYGEPAVIQGTTTYAPHGTSYIQVDVPGHDLCSANEEDFVPAGGGLYEWSCVIDPTDPDHLFEGGNDYPFTVRQEDLGAVPFATENHTFAYGNPLPEILQIDQPTEAGSPYVWSPDFLTISGVSPSPDGTVDIFLVGEGPLEDCQGLPVDFEGNWSCPATDIPWGEHTLMALQGDGDLSSEEVEIYVQLPAPQVDQSMLEVYEGDDAVYSGTVTYPGVDVEVYVSQDGSMVQICTTEEPGLQVGDAWECPITGLPIGHYDVTHSQVEGGFSGNSIVDTLDVVPELAITSPTGDDIEWMDGNFFTVSGTSAQTGPVDVYLDYDPEATNTPFCTVGGTAPTWTCDPIFLSPGAHTVRAEQDQQPAAEVSFDVLLPQPELPFGGYTVEPGDTEAAITGTVTYAGASTRVTVYEDFGEGYGNELATQTCPTGTASTFTCILDLSDLPEDRYVVVAVHVLPDQPEIGGVEATSYVYIDDQQYEGPALECTYGPGSATISNPEGDAVFSVWTAVGGGEESLATQGFCGGDAGYVSTEFDSWDFERYATCDEVCELTNLAPGIYDVYYGTSDGEGSSGSGFGDQYDYLFRVPEAPSLTTVISSANTVAVSGAATADDIVRLVSASGATLCSTTAEADGDWACAFTASTATTARAISIDAQSGGMSAYSDAGDIPAFLPPPTPPATPAPTPTPTIPTPLPTLPATPAAVALVKWLMSFDGDLMNLKPGDKFSVTLEGMPAGWTIEIVMHSTPVVLGTTTATGAPVTLQLTVPEGIESGAHRIEVVATTPLGTSYFQNADARVLGGAAPVEEPEDPATDEESGNTTEGGQAGSADRSDPAAPSGISGTLAPLSAIAANPATLAIAGGLALALLFLVALPTELLNSSLSSNTSRLGRAYGAVDGVLTKAQDWFITVTRSRAVAALILTTIVAVIYGFVDPGFGFDIVSLRLVLSLALAFFLLSYVASKISGLIIRRAWGAIGVVEMQPTIILFAVVGVIVARILDFSPGFLVGIAIGLELLQASRTVSARAVFVQIGVVTGLSLAAWGIYSVFTPGADFAGMLVEDTLVALTAEGLTGALIALFPLKFLDGADLWAVSKRLWVTAFLVVATAFSLLVLPTAIQGTDVADYGIWLLVFAVFGLVSLAVWLIFVRADAKAAGAEKESIDA